MTAPRVNEEEAERAVERASQLYYHDEQPYACDLIRRLLAERAALEQSVGNLKDEILRLDARLAEARKAAFAEVLERWHPDEWTAGDHSFADWLIAKKEGA